MKLSIGKKLGLGFGLVIILGLVSATIALVNLNRMNRAVENVVDEAVPTVRACDHLLSAVNESSTALRGYMMLGEDPKAARSFKTARAEAWRNIEDSMSDLDAHVRNWAHAEANAHLGELKSAFQELREVQQTIEETAHATENIPAYHLLFTEAVPRASEALKSLSAVIEAEKLEEASPERKALFAALSDLSGSFSQSSANLRAYLLSGDANFKQAFEKQWILNQETCARVLSMESLFTTAQLRPWKQFLATRSEYEPLPAKIFALRAASDWNKAEFLLEQEATPCARKLKSTLGQISAAANARREQRRAEMDSATAALTLSFLLGTLAAVLIGSLLAVVLSRKIVGMVRSLAERANEISQGNLTGNALLAKSGDELGQLADGFDIMLGNLKDLTGQILSVTENVNSAASQISSSAKQQACSTKDQATTVQEITSTMREIAESGTQIVEKAREVAIAAEAASQQSKSGIAAVQNTSQTMESIREQVEEVAENIVSLSEKTQAVGEIIATVNDIAEQSNLLALNATIEAADAGAEGNRFSVVANEMKSLADQAKSCTIQVRSILSEIQKGINSAVMLTEEAVKRVELGKQQADISEQAIRRMSETTGESVQAFQQIIGATNQQQIGFEQVAKGMQDIDQSTQQTASGTAQLEQAVVSLSAMSQQLKSAVSKYKLQI